MKKLNHKSASKVLVSLALCILLTGNLFPYIFGNGSGKGFCDPGVDPECDDGSNRIGYISTNSAINTYVEQGAGYFLNANSSFLSLLNGVELSNLNGIDYNETAQLLAKAIMNIQNAKVTYEQLIQVAEVTPYNLNFISKLKSFDYQGFMTLNNLNSVIFIELSEILKNGDIIGFYRRIHSKIVIVENSLLSIDIDSPLTQEPGLKLLWEANEIFQATLIFGQYGSRVFLSAK